MKTVRFAALGLLVLPALVAAQEAPVPLRVTFTNTDAALILRAIGSQTGATILYANKEKVPITIHLKAKTVEQAVKFVAAAGGLLYRKSGTTFIVAPEAALKGAIEPFVSRITFAIGVDQSTRFCPQIVAAFPFASAKVVGDRIVFSGLVDDQIEARELIESLSDRERTHRNVSDVLLLGFAGPAELAKVLSSLYPDLKFTAGGDDKAKGGILGISGPETSMAEARKMIKSLDVPAAMNAADTLVYRVYNLRYTSAPAAESLLKDAAPDIKTYIGLESFTPKRALFNPISAALASATLGGGEAAPAAPTTAPVAGISTEVGRGVRARTVVLHGRQAAVNAAYALLLELDVKPRQIVVDVQVLETSPDTSEQLGLKFNLTPFDFFELPVGTPVTGNPLPGSWTNAVTRPVGGGTLSRLPFGLRALFDAQIVDRKVRVLAKPSIRVIDNDEAHVFIGDTLRTRIVTQGSFGTQIVTVQEFPVGIILLIAPRVNPDGNITMKVNPAISSISGFDKDGLPQTSVREAETSMIVKDGETMILGGLIRDEDIRTVQSVPLLSRIPIIGELFKSRSKTKRRTEIVVSITPRLVPEDGAK